MDESLPKNMPSQPESSSEVFAPKQSSEQPLPTSPLPEHAPSLQSEPIRSIPPAEKIYPSFIYANQVRRGKFLFAFAFIAVFIFFGIRLLRMAGVNNLSQENFASISQSPLASPSQEFSEGTSVFILPSDVDVEEGDIISFTESKYHLSARDADEHMIGVVGGDLAVNVVHSDTDRGVNVIFNGKSLVRVSTINGLIHAGDFISSSRIPGIGTKATQYGPVLGIALSDYAEPNVRRVERIPVAIHITTRTPFTYVSEHPIETIRYILAFLIALTAVVVGFIYFGKVAESGVEALGRNPLSGRLIQSGVLMNLGFMIAVIGCAILISYLLIV